MAENRKYRQHGYMDRGEQKPQGGEKPQRKQETFGPRSIQMPGTKELSRCAQCGAILSALIGSSGQCPKCAAALHSCKQCTYFDPSSQFECRQPVKERISRKDAANDCRFFSLRVRIEKETSTAPVSANDARRAFENLFKK